MDKRYQVFISSTYNDLKDERQAVLRALMTMDCIPAGMELFPATDEEQFEFIKKIIDDCDFYILIIAGRYGTVTTEGISYTEKEFDYAKEKGLPVLVFVHSNPEAISVGRSEKDQALAKKLEEFRQKASSNRLRAEWDTPDKLASQVVLSLSQTMKAHKAIGWVRANTIGSTELLTQISDLAKENQTLRAQIQAGPQSAAPVVPDIAGLNEVFSFRVEYKYQSASAWQTRDHQETWAAIFGTVAPYLLEFPSDSTVGYKLAEAIRSKLKPFSPVELRIKDQDFQTIKVQLSALQLVDLQFQQSTTGPMALFWHLTDRGRDAMFQLRSVRSTPTPAGTSESPPPTEEAKNG